jgi:1-pyrroline-5-carboxylate dehydrogenase
MWKKIGQNISKYQNYPRIVGETGGKDFIIAHSSASKSAFVTALIRGAFQYQGQKCSAVSRAYIPENLWGEIKQQLMEDIASLTMGDVEDFRVFMGAVIDEAAFHRITKYIQIAKTSPDAEILTGGQSDKTIGYFVKPTVVKTSNPKFQLMTEEIFGPILTIYVYPEDHYQETLEMCNATSPYALTGAIFARDRVAIKQAMKVLQYAAGNFYINDKPTGAIVGRQPFGGARGSGTNDKAGSLWNLIRWVSPRTIKETYNPPENPKYPYMSEK